MNVVAVIPLFSAFVNEPVRTFTVDCVIALFAVIVPLKFNVPVFVVALSVIVPKLFVPFTFNSPSFWIVPALDNVVFTVIDLFALFVNVLSVAMFNVPCVIVPLFAKSLFRFNTPVFPDIIPAFSVFPFIVKVPIFSTSPPFVKVVFTVTVLPELFVNFLASFTVNAP